MNNVKTASRDNTIFLFLCVFFVALTVRFLAVLLLPIETWEYEIIAKNFLEGKGFIYPQLGVNYRSYCEPLYPVFCIFVYLLTGHDVFVLVILQAVFSALIAVVIFFCAKKLFGRKAAFIAGILAAFHPGLIAYTTKLHPLTFDALFIGLALLATFNLAENFCRRNLIIAGLVNGMCVLTRPTILIFMPFALFFILRKKKIEFRRGLIYAIVFFVSAAAVFSPWTIRNYLVQKKFVLTRSGMPFVFWLGNNPNFSGSALDNQGGAIFDLAPEEFKEKVSKLDEMAQNKEFLNSAFDYIMKHPFKFLERTAIKFFYFWWFSPQAGLLYPKIYFILYKIFYLLAFSLGLLGVFTCLFGRQVSYKENLFNMKIGILLIIVMLLTISISQSLFYIETRHRWAVEPIFLIFTAKGIYYILERFKLVKDIS